MHTIPEYRQFVKEIIAREAMPPHKYGHQVRLYELSREIGAGMEYDDDVVFAAAWLHDLGVFEGNRPEDIVALQQWDHVAYAVARTIELLSASDFPAEKIAQVVKVIEEHQPRDTPTSLEAVIVRDADILEQLGAVTILRTAAKLGSDTRFIYFADVKAALERQVRDLPTRLQLERSRELAAARVESLSGFLSALGTEAGAHLG